MSEALQKESNILDSIIGIFEEVSKTKEQQREIDDYLYTNHRIPRGTINELLVNPEKFELNRIEEQAAIVNAIYQITKSEDANPENFFNQKQIGKSKKFKLESEIKVELPVTFDDYYVIQTSENDYLTAMKYKTIGALWNAKVLGYNMSLQRKPKEKVNRKGELVKTPKVIQRSVSEITDLMKRKRFRSNTITFCILMDGNEEITYDEGELTLVAGNMFIIDGYHRLSAILNILEEDSDNESSIDVAIKYLTFSDAQYYLGQLNKMSKFDKSFVNYLMNDKLQDKIVREIEIKSVLNGRITSDATVAKKKTYLTSTAVLSNGIKDIFNPQDNKDRLEVVEVLVNFFDYLIDYYPDEFSKETVIQSREKDLRNYHNTFVLYLVAAKCLFDKYGKNIPTDEIVRVVNLFDYSNDGEYSKVLFSEGTGKINSNQVKKNIREYAYEKIKANL